MTIFEAISSLKSLIFHNNQPTITWKETLAINQFEFHKLIKLKVNQKTIDLHKKVSSTTSNSPSDLKNLIIQQLGKQAKSISFSL